MSARLRYECETNHVEKITGRIIAHELSFEVEVGNGNYKVKIKQDQADSAIVLHGGTIPAFIEALQEIQDLCDQAEHGTRFDLNPTVDSRKGAVAYIDYLYRIDNTIRSQAKAALESSDSSKTKGENNG